MGAECSSVICAAFEVPATHSCRIEALLEIEKEATQNCPQSCGKL